MTGGIKNPWIGIGVIAIIVMCAILFLVPRNSTPQTSTASQNLIPVVYPLYPQFSWGAEVATTTSIGGKTVSGYEVTSEPVKNVTDLSAIFLPFENYYDGKLVAAGWVKNPNYEADGPGGSLWVYTKGSQYILFVYYSQQLMESTDTPFSCPCDTVFSIFTGALP